ncbi:MAG: 2-octaprenyl-6-methoxyphenyl hydroxylase [Spiribacter sp.]|jgi:2-octaprenyl-6-methoxyphenol hydroxylase|nr:2-octaprenyl-6-methoxyphenyl hydroxylase [Spiribacter sp.]MDR9489848.1 2-octaprenyl-6-methoxyphenyl hydroxylase [Spiribacter sp.]
MSDTHFDVVIAGGGLVGSSLAVALQGSGLRVAVVEPIPEGDPRQPSFDDRHTALAPTSRRFFERLGLWPEILASAYPIEHIHVSDQGHGGFTRLSAKEEGLPALGHVTPNRVLGAALRPAMEKAADLFCPAEILDSVIVEGADATAGPSVRQVRVKNASGEQTLTTRLLVVADGMRSSTRDALNIAMDEKDYGQSAIIVNLRSERHHGGMAYERFTPEGPIALLPAGENTVSLVWALPHEQAKAMAHNASEAVFLDRLQAAFGWRLGKFSDLGHCSVYPLIAVTAQQFTSDRAVILGNAAHALHPVAGQGLNLALRDVAALAELLGAPVDSESRQQTPTDPGGADVLAEYAPLRQGDYRRTFGFTNGLVTLFSNDWLPLVAVRNMGLTALDLFPPARRFLLKHATGAAGNVPALCRED